MRRIAGFIDGAYLGCLKNGYGRSVTDFELLAQRMAGNCEILRTSFYDCLPYQSSPPTEDELRRVHCKRRFLDALGSIPRFQVRLGHLQLRGWDENGNPRFQQKQADLLLGVDLAILAAKAQITDAAILAGDSDLIPAIDAAKREGVVVHLFHGPNTRRDLLQICDERVLLTPTFLESVSRGRQPVCAQATDQSLQPL